MSRRNRRGLVLAVAAAVVGLLGYLAYEVYQESKHPDDDDDDDADDGDSEVLQLSDNEDSIEDIIHIPQAQSGDRPAALPIGTRTTAANNQKRALAVSARGAILDSTDPHNRWSAEVHVRSDAVQLLSRLAALYDVYLVVVVSQEADRLRVMRELEASGVVSAAAPGSPTSSGFGESVVWVDGSDASSEGPSEIPSSAVSAILNSPGVLPASHVLFCQTEEGKIHLVRHLLTAQRLPGGRARYAGFIDTNRDVMAKLGQVLHTAVLLSDNHIAHIGSGEVPNAPTALTPRAGTSDSRPEPALPKSVQVVDDITQSSLLS
ncbi:hypothetical protein GGF46_002138 [Coemansia sp. RSA 552]|nr:hypothetical protein GGF46_002138 [Coemansia sp. RSA 552]